MQHLKAVWTFRHFLFALVRLDLRLRYRRSVLGVGWSLLNPIAMTAVFTVVFSTLLGGGNWRTYAPFLLAGMAVWGFLRDAATQGCRSLLANEAYIRQSPLPFGLYPLRTVLGLAIHFLIALAVLIGLLAVIQQSMAAVAAAWLILPGVLLAFVAAWALATVAAFANVYFHDTQHILEVLAQIGFFLTPIIYTRAVLDGKGLGWLVDLNPAVLFLDMIREPLLTGQPAAAKVYATATAVTGGLVVLAAGVMGWLQKRVIFHM